MSEHENFLERWSRRKRGAAGEPDSRPQGSEIKKDDAAGAAPAESAPSADAKDTEKSKPFDLADLPSIESIGANTDIRGFLQPGVPEELKRAALRRAWSSDPAIRDFVGLVENGWDFNDPNAMPGFGSIAAEDVARLLTQAVGAVAPEQPKEEPAEQTQAAEHEQTAQNPQKSGSAESRAGSQAEASTERASVTLHCNEDDASQKDSGT